MTRFAAQNIASPAECIESCICIVTETYPPEINGVALTLAQLVRGLRERGHNLSVIRPRQDSDSGACRYEYEPVLLKGMPLPGYRGLQFGLPAGRLLRRLWMRRRPDVIYVATEGPLGWSAVCAAARMGIPALSGFHTHYDIYSRFYRLGSLQALVFQYLRAFHNRTTATLVASAELRSRLRVLGFRNLIVLGRGVDARRFAPGRRCARLRSTWGLSEHELAAIYVGRLAGEKNLGLAIEAYRAMKRHRPAMRLVLVGDGPIRTALQRRHPDVIFAGLQTGDELAKHYASGDIFLFPSETETFGNVTLEAMASGLAVIAYDYAAAKIHIADGASGVLVPYGNSQAFIDRAAALAAAPQAIDQIKQRARRHALTADWPHVVARFEALLTAACGYRKAALNDSIALGMADPGGLKGCGW